MHLFDYFSTLLVVSLFRLFSAFIIALAFLTTAPARATVPAWCKFAFENQEIVTSALQIIRPLQDSDREAMHLIANAAFDYPVTLEDLAAYIRQEPWLSSYLDVAEKLDHHYEKRTSVTSEEIEKASEILNDDPTAVIKMFEPRFLAAVESGIVYKPTASFTGAMVLLARALNMHKMYEAVHDVALFVVEHLEPLPPLKAYTSLIRQENGMAYYEEESYLSAIQELQRAIELNPEGFENYSTLGNAWVYLANKIERTRLPSLINAYHAYVTLYSHAPATETELRADVKESFQAIANTVQEEYGFDLHQLLPQAMKTIRELSINFEAATQAAFNIATRIQSIDSISPDTYADLLDHFFHDYVSVALEQTSKTSLMTDANSIKFKKEKLLPILKFMERAFPKSDQREMVKELIQAYRAL